MKEQDIKKYHFLPGHMVSVDHYILRSTGRLYHKKGKSYPSDMFSGGCVFIDHDSGYVSIKHQMAINATENIKEKITFYRESQSQGVTIKGCHTDNGIFNESDFMEELFKKEKNIMFSGASISHQNGTADRAIKMLVTMARNVLMYADLRCLEDTLYTYIWPMEMDYSVWVYNHIPDMHYGLSAIEICSRSRFEPVSETHINCYV